MVSEPPELNAKSVESRVLGWLERQGYPLELETAQAFQRRQAYVVQAEYFDDPETHELREIDVRATFLHDDLMAGDVSFAIECKLSTDKPWIAFVSRRLALNSAASILQRAASDRGHKFLQSIADNPTAHALPLLRPVSQPAYGVTQAFTNATDIAYSAVMSATKAALATAVLDDEHGALSVAFPVIVIDGLLFDCWLDPTTKQIMLKETTRTTLIWRRPVVAWPRSIVTIATRAGLSDYVDDAEITAAELLDMMHRSSV